jgi:hypothetical protein
MPLINHNNAVILYNTVENIVGIANAQIIDNNDNANFIMIKNIFSPLLYLHIQISYNFSTIDFLATLNVFL